MKILGIETSCDDTAVAIYDAHQGLLGQLIHSQTDLHKIYGGVVPELASRDHIQKLLPLIQALLKNLNLDLKDLSAIAYTRGPGLIGALMVGSSVARSLAFSLNIPSIGVHHLESHMMAVMLEKNQPTYPFVTLLASGGHTSLLLAEQYGQYVSLGATCDDAAGEAFDKTAKLLNLSYPNGATLAEFAQSGDPTKFHFPRPMTDQSNCDFSFSGLKTNVSNLVKKLNPDEKTKKDIAASFEQAIIETLVKKSERALRETHCTQLVIAGGVSANQKLRQLCNKLTRKHVSVFFPRLELCTDNAAMVAFNGFLRISRGEKDALNCDVKAKWSIQTIE